MPSRRRRRTDAAASPEPQRPTQAGDMFHWSILFPVAHWDLAPQEENEWNGGDIAINQIQSYKWLQARARSLGTRGFLLIQQLAPLNRLLLVHDLYTEELVINKRVRKYLKRSDLATLYPERKDIRQRLPRRLQMYAHPIPGDIRFARISGDHRDPRVEVRLPDEPYFQKLYAYGFPHDQMYGHLDHGMVEKDGRATEEVYNASLYYEYLNGGSLEHAIMRINWGEGERARCVEEPFIWHLIEQLSRALLYLHWGVERQGNERNEDGERIPRNWQPVCHRWLTMDNIMLHWPEYGEEGYEESMDGRLPRVVLTNFDNAARKGEEPHDNGIIHFGRLTLPKDRILEARYGVSPRDRVWQMEEPDTWQDIYAMGKLLRRILLDRRRPGLYDIQMRGQKNWFNSETYDLAPFAQSRGGPYSDELIDAIRWFESTGPDGEVTEWKGNARFTEDEKPGRLNSVAGLEDQLLEEAESHVETFRENEPPVAANQISIATVRPPDLRHYHMPFRTRRIREKDAENEMQVMMESLNGPAYKVVVEYGHEHENARLAKTDKMRELEEKRAAEEREIDRRAENMFRTVPDSLLGKEVQEEERKDYRGRLRKRKDREFRDETMRLVGKKIKKARKRRERKERQQEEGEAADGSEWEG
ncbi:uncharacterized protein B0T23DRAFT_44124 [Neurospora hispaniola]|uniref:Protein kinase domain-containing protein n=1 Tax=Neurospora hispaniola TaxID=588809 RepID=A0AAJ0MM30_9PEZI|nr:hypothetical protein B0T23DRAFT_44124 [Neurospora hispaniola]